EREGLLIVLTSLKTQSALSEAGVWRGLSNRIAAEEWLRIPNAIALKKKFQEQRWGPRSPQRCRSQFGY
ncbi:MAG: hypothetical protein SVX43_00960, partial [Cyanobacteriota bacterium]|nr:hypothetical protein [Cyanobacteriota bacterium]